MDTKVKDGKLVVKLHKKDITVLDRATELGCLLVELRHDELGNALAEAADAILTEIEPLTVKPEAAEPSESES